MKPKIKIQSKIKTPQAITSNIKPSTKQATNFTSISESIAKDIINKLISLAIYKHQLNKIEKKLPHYCYCSSHKLISSFLSLYYMSYDKDEIIERSLLPFDQSNISMIDPLLSEPKFDEGYLPMTTYFYDNYSEGENNWSMIPMPSSTPIDRYTPCSNEYIKANKRNESNEIKEEATSIHNSENVDQMQVNQSFNNKLIPRRITHRILKGEETKRTVNSKSAIEFISFDLPKEKHHGIDIDISEFRNEIIEEENQLKEKDKVNTINIDKVNRQRGGIQSYSKPKEFERKNIVVDADRKVVEVKKVLLERLPREFGHVSSDQKDKGIINNQFQLNHQSQYHSSVDTTSITKQLNKQTSKAKLLNSNPIYNGVLSLAIPDKLEEKEHFIGAIEPAGSNFDLMKMEVGVELFEDSKYKTGGKDFYNKYHKYSINSFKEQNETYKYYQKDMVNPAIDSKSNNHDSLSSSESKAKKDDQKIHFTDRNDDVRRRIHNLNSRIKVKNKNSIKNAFDRLELIYEKDELKDDLSKEYKTSTYFFKSRRKSDIIRNNITRNDDDKKNMEEMLKFNSTIMASKNWGNSSTVNPSKDKNYKRYPVNSKGSIIGQAIDINIAKVKMPRSRMYSYIRPPFENSFICKGLERGSSTGFFKVIKKNNSKASFSRTVSDKLMRNAPKI